MRACGRFLLVLFPATILCALLFNAGLARATYDPIAGGATKLTLAKAFTSLLSKNAVRLGGGGGVSVAGNSVTFPISGGKLEPVEAKGTVEHSGALVFRAGPRSLPLRALQLKTTRPSAPYAAKLGGGQLKLASTSKLTNARLGFGSRFAAANLRLSAKAATRLDKKLGLRGVFAAGQLLGSATTTAQPAGVGIAAVGKAELAIDPAFAAKLQSFFVAVNPVAPAEHPGAFTLPIAAGGALAPDASSGVLKTSGALEFIQVGGGQFFARELEADLGAHFAGGESQLVLAASGPGPNVAGPIFGLGAGSASADPDARMISLSAAPLTLEAGTAQAFDDAFAKPLGKAGVFMAGEIVGTFGFAAQAE